MANDTAARRVLRAKLRPPRIHALSRQRLDDKLDDLWSYRMGLVVGPAGFGKTTLLAQFAARADAHVAWYRADEDDASSSALLCHLERAFHDVIGDLTGGWVDVDDAVSALEAVCRGRALLIVDDLHVLQDTLAERSLARLIEYAPPSLTVLAASRHPPSFNLSRLRVSGDLLEIGTDDLRFRSWEVERLFHDFYGQSMTPEDLATLARRTEGWAAGLQLFHIATRGKTPAERSRILAALATRSRLVREYLSRNVVDELPLDVRRFVLGTCVLGRLTATLCDELLEAGGSGAYLRELERRQVFTTALDDEGTYRYDTVLRSHLEAALIESLGEPEARARHRRAAELLEAAGWPEEALRSYGRAEEWESAARLLGEEGHRLAGDDGPWIDALPPALVNRDPWLMLTMARRHVAAGHWQLGLGAYQRAEGAMASAAGADTCRQERLALAAWFEPVSMPPPGWMGLVLSAVRREPMAAWREAAALPGPTGRLAAGLAALLAGYPLQARSLLMEVAESAASSPPLCAGARLGAAHALQYTLLPGALAEIEQAGLEAERAGLPWLVRISRSMLAIARPAGTAEAVSARKSCQQDGDDWGHGLAALFEAFGSLRAGGAPAEVLEDGIRCFRKLGAGALEGWCRAALALALSRRGDDAARDTALEAEAYARAIGVRGAQAVALVALGLVDGIRGPEHLARADAIAKECGLGLADLVGPESVGSGEGVELRVDVRGGTVGCPLTMRCFGPFHLAIDEHVVDLGAVKPRVLATLQLLALHAGRPVHRETIIEALWPYADLAAGARNLQVAISSLRQLLEPNVPRGQSALLVRDGDAYRLVLPTGADADVVTFERAFQEAKRARVDGNEGRALACLERAFAAYGGELLPELGPAEWVVKERERYCIHAAEVAQMLAQLRLQRGDAPAARELCQRGLRIDRYHDGLWRLLIDTSKRAGDPAAAARARRNYDEVLAELGVQPR